MKLNRIVKYLIASDLIFYTGWGLISPIFAVFILQNINAGSVFVVGMASAVNLLTRSLLRVPFGIKADGNQKTAFNFMFLGLLLASFVPIGYIFAVNPLCIYVLQAFLGVSLAMSTAGWTSIFAKHMDRGKESTEWGIDAVAVGIGPGIAGALGGLFVTLFSFNAVFIAVSIAGLLGTFIQLVVKKEVLEYKEGSGKIFVSHELRRLKKARVH